MKASHLVLTPVVAMLAVAACADPTSLEAEGPTLSGALTVYALSASPAAFPSAIHVASLTALRVDGALNFDVAFDIDAQGRAVLYPMSLLFITSRTDIHPVGIQKLTVPFDQLTRAPAGGYISDAPLTLAVGEAAVIEATVPRLCGYPFPLQIYAKIVVDSIKASTRSIHLRGVSDPNCGFRSFATGVPVD